MGGVAWGLVIGGMPVYPGIWHLMAGRLQRGQNPGKLLPADAAGIGMRHDYPSPGNSLNLTHSGDRRQALRSL